VNAAIPLYYRKSFLGSIFPNVAEARHPTRGPALELFISQLAEIAPWSKERISPQSHLIEDLGFDSPAFSQLGLLLYERYGIAGLSTASLPDGKHLTVEAFFQHCVLDVLGIDPRADYIDPGGE
jgi:hypothetical protein